MINHITGTILYIDLHTLVIQANGIGYRVHVPQHVIGSACSHEQIELWTSFVVREQSQELYGFITRDEYQIFEKLIGVSGVGPKSALALFDTLPAEQLVQALINRDAAAIARAPGLGKKTAEKIVLELADNAAILASSPASDRTYTPQSEMFDALVGLGYGQHQIRDIINKLDTEQSFEEQLRQALRELGTRG